MKKLTNKQVDEIRGILCKGDDEIFRRVSFTIALSLLCGCSWTRSTIPRNPPSKQDMRVNAACRVVEIMGYPVTTITTHVPEGPESEEAVFVKNPPIPGPPHKISPHKIRQTVRDMGLGCLLKENVHEKAD